MMRRRFRLASCVSAAVGLALAIGCGGTDGGDAASGDATPSTGSTGGGANAGSTSGSGGAGPATSSSASVTTGTSTSTASGGGGGAGGGTGGSGGAGGSGGDPTHGKIQHVIVIVKENHTFDNYFGSFPGAEGATTFATKDGVTHTAPKAKDTVRDMCHEHSCALTDWNHGAMNGWEDNADSNQNNDYQAWAQYDESSIPNYWAYAKNFTLADHFFANVLGPSFPGHTFVLAAQAGWATGNPDTTITHPYWGCDQSSNVRVETLVGGTCQTQDVFPCFSIPSVPSVLPDGVSWRFYGTNFYFLSEVWSMFDAIDPVRNTSLWNNITTVDNFVSDIDNHTLPNVIWLVDQDLDSEHPGVGSVCAGENWSVGFINKIMQSDYWDSTAILLTMDDFGGWYDHVKPPRQYGCDDQTPYGLGFRLPLTIISPYAKPGYVFKEQSEQASIPKFIETVFGAPPLSSLDPAAQDGAANDLMNAFDFTQAPNAPLVLQTRTCL